MILGILYELLYEEKLHFLKNNHKPLTDSKKLTFVPWTI